MKTFFDTNKYSAVHGRMPRGFGSWAFTFDNNDADVFMVHVSTYAQARHAAAVEAKNRRARTVVVMP